MRFITDLFKLVFIICGLVIAGGRMGNLMAAICLLDPELVMQTFIPGVIAFLFAIIMIRYVLR